MTRCLRLLLIGVLLTISLNGPALADALNEAGIPLVINEVMASNSSSFQDPQGEYDDWIEIHNYGRETIDLGGMFLTDEVSIPTKWMVPANTRIQPGGFLIIWADNDIADPGLHANFKLNDRGEQVSLFDSDGATLIDSLAFGEQTSDISYGRYPDAGDDMRFFNIPSPSARNDNAYLGAVEKIGFSHTRGFYESPITVTLATETEDAIIYYSLDGTEPYEMTDRGRAVGIIYTGPIPISKTTCLRAVAVKPGWMPTKTVTQTYLFLDDVIRQDHQATLNAGFPTSWGSYSSPDYGMDRDIIGTFSTRGLPNGDDRYNRRYAITIRSDLLSIPTLSISMNIDDMFGRDGIYSNPTQHGIAYERPASIELIYPDGTEGFQINCGIRIQGGAFRNFSLATKKSFRLLFKGIYGPGKLEFPLFGEDATDTFDTIVLRAGANDGYSWRSARYTEQYTRDEFGRSLQRAMGHAGAHGTFVHLYINGIYWGLYNPCERPDHSFSASYHGGDRDNWDAIHDNSASNGNKTAWNRMIALCREAATSNEAYLELQNGHLDVTNYVDYLIVNLWGGNWDWPWKNWWAGRDQSDDSTGFKFYNWDYENTMGNNLSRSPLNKNALNNNFSQAGVPHQSLRQNPEYRLFFADRIHRLFFNGGVLTPESLIRRYAELAGTVERAIVAESARWGDQHHSTPLTLEEWYDRDSNFNDGRAGRDWILRYYLPQRTEIVLQQFRDAGLYPNVEAPVFRINGSYQHGGSISPHDELSMTAPTGDIWYTLDGADPRLSAEPSGESTSTTLLTAGADKRVLVPTGPVSNRWKNDIAFDDSTWMESTGPPGGVGYERSSGYQDFLSLDVEQQMYRQNATCYIRIPFMCWSSTNEFNFLTLHIRYDDAFVAYLNGVEVARRNANGTPSWNSNASASHSDSEAVLIESIDLSATLDTLQRGHNLLAIHGLNISTTSSDLLIWCELTAGQRPAANSGEISPTAMRYTEPIRLNHSANVKARVLNRDTWSALNEAVYAVGPVTENLRITEIMYHPQSLTDSTEPNEEFIELANIGTDTINLNLVRFTNGIDFTFPSLDLAPGEYVIVVQDREAFEARYGMDIPIAGQYTGRLNNAGERITLTDAIGQTILDFDYNNSWYSLTDDEGFSLTVIDPANSDINSDAWRASTYIGGSPGQDDNGILPNPGDIVINELFANSPGGVPDWIELYNITSTPIDLSGWFLSDNRDNLFKYEIAPGTTIGPNAYLVFYEDVHFGNTNDAGGHEPFALNNNGESVILSSAQDGILTGYREVEDFGASAPGVSFGRYIKSSTGTTNFVAMESPTPGSENAYPSVGPIVISEIMYHPDWPDGGLYTNEQYEYIELYNISTEPVTLYDSDNDTPWAFTRGIDFAFPSDVPVTIPAGEYLLIVKHPEAFTWRYPNVPAEKILGPYEGKLNNAGERLELSMPGDDAFIRIDRVNYSDGSSDLWPTEPDGAGLSLTRRIPADYGNDPDNWQAASPTPGY